MNDYFEERYFKAVAYLVKRAFAVIVGLSIGALAGWDWGRTIPWALAGAVVLAVMCLFLLRLVELLLDKLALRRKSRTKVAQ